MSEGAPRPRSGARAGRPAGSVGGTWQRIAVWGKEGGIGIAMNRVWGPYDERRPPSAAAICAPMPRIGPSRHRFRRRTRRRAAPSESFQALPAPRASPKRANRARTSVTSPTGTERPHISMHHLRIQNELYTSSRSRETTRGCGTAPLIRHPWISMRGPATAPLVPTSVDTDARTAARHITPGDGHAARTPHGTSVNGGSSPRCAPPRPARRASPPTHPSRCRASRSPRSGAPWDSGRRARGRTPRGRSRRPAPRRSC